MKHAAVAVAILTLLAGCAATQTPADQASNWDICKYTMGGGQNAQVADAERQRRGLDCAPYYPAIQQQRQNEAQAMQYAARYFAPRPAAPPIPRPIQCRTVYSGNVANTYCD